MQEPTVNLYFFKNVCRRCFQTVEMPFLSDFSYGEILCQIEDGQDFYVASLIDNPAFDFIISYLAHRQNNAREKIDAQNVLILVADKPDGKQITSDYPICPNCRKKQRHFNDNTRTELRSVSFLAWKEFEVLTEEEKQLKIEFLIGCRTD